MHAWLQETHADLLHTNLSSVETEVPSGCAHFAHTQLVVSVIDESCKYKYAGIGIGLLRYIAYRAKQRCRRPSYNVICRSIGSGTGKQRYFNVMLCNAR
eukprot:673263-Pelagomonas_calceolata.AAC.8